MILLMRKERRTNTGYWPPPGRANCDRWVNTPEARPRLERLACGAQALPPYYLTEISPLANASVR